MVRGTTMRSDGRKDGRKWFRRVTIRMDITFTLFVCLFAPSCLSYPCVCLGFLSCVNACPYTLVSLSLSFRRSINHSIYPSICVSIYLSIYLLHLDHEVRLLLELREGVHVQSAALPGQPRPPPVLAVHAAGERPQGRVGHGQQRTLDHHLAGDVGARSCSRCCGWWLVDDPADEWCAGSELLWNSKGKCFNLLSCLFVMFYGEK